jgi:hypothetical protein
MLVTVDICGGLGNQLFQIFALIAYALKYNYEFKFNYLDESPSITVRKTYWNDFLINLRGYTQTNLLIDNIYREPYFNYNHIPFFDSDITLSGYFQSPLHFIDYYDKIIDLIKLNAIKQEIKEKYNFNNDNSISIHFRLGDYKYLQHTHPIMPITYYINALNNIIIKTNKNDYNIYYFGEDEDIIIIEDQITLLKKEFNNLNFISLLSKDILDWEQLILMSLCSHNIIANSSFSWWGAYFNSNINKIICYPSLWFNNDLYVDDLFPWSWFKINV